MAGGQSSSGASSCEATARARVAVLTTLPLDTVYDYLVPEGIEVSPGEVVEVPVGRTSRLGVVWGEAEGSVEAAKLRPIAGRFAVPPLPEVARRFVDWVAAYTLAPRGSVLRMSLSVSDALFEPRPTIAYAALPGGPDNARITGSRRRVLAVLEDGPPRSATELAREAGCGTGVVKAMAKAGLLTEIALPPRLPFGTPDTSRRRATLTPDQAAAAALLTRRIEEGGTSVTLLDGVTGSGKTEVYLEAVARALDSGRQALVLLPEIALSAQWLARFEERFGARPALWHSELTGQTRRLTWRAVAEGRARVVVGARSALFLPYPDLGLIVVDEEHEHAYKQEDGVVYQARDMAVARGHLGRIPVVLVSATPSLETVVNVETGKYAEVRLPDRHGGAALPEIDLVDMRAAAPPRGRFLSPVLLQALKDTLERGEQAMLFLNRRGYAPLTLCRACGHRLECPNCSAWLVDHRLAGRLECHHCGHRIRRPSLCPSCNAEDSLVPCGPGVERLAEEIDLILPDLRWTIVASDTLSGPSAMEDLARQIEAGAIDLLIGTQIMAKGHHFPRLTLVGVVDADLGLAGGDLRGAERTFQLLQQVAGRAGRGDAPGRVLLQTWMPEHPVMQALSLGDRDGFLAREADARRSRGLPPFGRLVALIVSGEDRDRVDRTAAAIGRAAPRLDGVEVLGPADAPLALLRGQHRRRLLLKAPKTAHVQRIVQDWLARAGIPSGVRVTVDVDPYSFL